MKSNRLKKLFIALSVLVILGVAFGLGVFCQYKREEYAAHLEKLDVLDVLDPRALALGQAEMAKHKLIICGITRDNMRDLQVMKRHLEHLGLFFADYRIVLFENDSKDGTKEMLKSWAAANPKVKIISKDFNNKRRPNIKFMAACRNYCLNEVAENSQYKDFDMIMVVDMDMRYGFDIRGIQHSFSQFNRWDGVCSNGIKNKRCKMQDIFAFHNAEFPLRPSDRPDYWDKNSPVGQKTYPVNSDLVPVYSCFGGMAFYKRDAVRGCRYDSINEDCEHLPFHACMAQQNHGRMFMNPAQLIRYTQCRRLPSKKHCVRH